MVLRWAPHLPVRPSRDMICTHILKRERVYFLLGNNIDGSSLCSAAIMLLFSVAIARNMLQTPLLSSRHVAFNWYKKLHISLYITLLPVLLIWNMRGNSISGPVEESANGAKNMRDSDLVNCPLAATMFLLELKFC